MSHLFIRKWLLNKDKQRIYVGDTPSSHCKEKQWRIYKLIIISLSL